MGSFMVEPAVFLRGVIGEESQRVAEDKTQQT
jgi:hypothetical protein